MALPDLNDPTFLLQTFQHASPLMPQPLAQQAAPGGYTASGTAANWPMPRSVTMYGSRADAQAAAGPNATPVPNYGSRAAAQQAAAAGAGRTIQNFNSRADAQAASQNDARNIQTLRNAYRMYLGRDIDEAGLRAHLANPEGVTGALAVIKNSPEAQAYRARQSAAPPTDMPSPPGGVWNERPPMPQVDWQKNGSGPYLVPQRPPALNKDGSPAGAIGRTASMMANPGTPFQYRMSRGTTGGS